MLTKKHFEQIAEFLGYQEAYFMNDLKEQLESGEIDQKQLDDKSNLVRRIFEEVTSDLIEYFSEENPRFEQYRFLDYIKKVFDEWKQE